MDQILAGRYEFEVPLGRGGSGEVWRGRDLATRRPVAIKLVELSRIDDPSLLAETIGRFRREAMVVAGLRHPNIVSSLDAGRIGSHLFMIMEMAPGVSLASMMDERGARGMGLFPVSSVLRMAEEVCAGLAAAHAAGVVHRDIKPSNLMVTPQLGVTIIDFGIARLLSDNSPRLTLQGHTVGTIAYMSPEQAQGGDVDVRTDLYSLGCVLYQLLSGRLPFKSSLPGALLMMQVMDTATPLNVIRPDLPDGLTELVSDLMAKDRAARPANAAAVISRLHAIGETLGSDEPVHEADRQTVRAGDPSDAVGGTRLDLHEARSAGETRSELAAPDLAGPAVLTPDRLAEVWGSDTVPAPGWPAQGAPVQSVRLPPHLGTPPQLPVQSYRGTPQPPIPPRPGGSSQPFLGPVSAPQAWQTPPAGAGRSSAGAPAWPAPSKRRPRRRRWGGLISTVLTVALAAGVWIYVWDRTHEKLKITSVAVTAANQSVGCNGTADIIGTINTNGHGGPVTYQWIYGTNQNPPVLTADDASGSDKVQVQLKWAFHGKGTGKAVAKLRVLTPDPAEASITFPYSCPS